MAGVVAVDVERLDGRLDTEALLAGVACPDDEPFVSTDCPEARTTSFFRLWTRKEAYAKATGDGLALPMREISIVLEDEDQRVLALGRDVPAGRVCDLDPEPGYVAAVARVGVADGPIRLEVQSFDPSR